MNEITNTVIAVIILLAVTFSKRNIEKAFRGLAPDQKETVREILNRFRPLHYLAMLITVASSLFLSGKYHGELSGEIRNALMGIALFTFLLWTLNSFRTYRQMKKHEIASHFLYVMGIDRLLLALLLTLLMYTSGYRTISGY